MDDRKTASGVPSRPNHRCIVGLLALFACLCVYPALAADLKQVKTKHYSLHTDVEPALAKDLALRLDAMYEEYDRRLADFKTTNDEKRPFEVYVFNERDDYMKFTGNRLANTGGVFIPHKNQLVAFLKGQGRDGLRRTLQHEAFHQFAYRSISQDLPPWLNEGMAQLFEESIWTGRSFMINQVPPRRIRQLQNDIKTKRLIAFDRFLKTTLDEWLETLIKDAERGATQYNQAWAMVHFLVNAGTEDGGKAKYRDRLVEMLKKTNAGMPAGQAFDESFSDNVKGFQERFVEYARDMKPTPASAMLERQNVLADLFKGLSANGRSFKDVTAFKNEVMGGGYRLTYPMGTFRWETDPNAAVYFSNMDGKPFDRDSLYFEPRRGAPLPDLVCKPGGRTQIRSRFFREEDAIEHEVLVEPIR
jgi:hypothetical protein